MTRAKKPTAYEKRVQARIQLLLHPAAAASEDAAKASAGKKLAPSRLLPAFTVTLRQEKITTKALRPHAALRVLVSYYDSVAFAGRERGTIADMLLYQHGSRDGVIVVGFVRQLYARGLGKQLTIDFEYPAARKGRAVKAVTCWTSKFESVDAWANAVEEHLKSVAGVLGGTPTAVRVHLEEF